MAGLLIAAMPSFDLDFALDEAIEIQLRLEREWDEAGEPDPYVFEELEHLYRALQDGERADFYAARRKATI
jgi:hypothetical protein